MPEKELEELKITLAVLTERVESWMTTTNEYRKSLCSKIDSIQDKLANLPCEFGNARYQGLATQVKWMWGLLCSIIVLAFTEVWKRK